MKYPLLTWVMKVLLNNDIGRDIFDNRDSVYNSITPAIRTGLLKEIADANDDPDFSWLELAFDTGWFHSSFRNHYDLVLLTDEEVFEYFRLWICYALYPETIYDEQHHSRLFVTVYYILRDAALIKGSDGWISLDEIIQNLKSRDAYWAHLQRFHFEYLVRPRGDIIEHKRRLKEDESRVFFGISFITHLRLSQFGYVDNFFKEIVELLNLDATQYPELNWPTKDIPWPFNENPF